MELCIGTVQFGLDYGIKGQKRPSIDDSVKCLDYAVQNSVTAIDTAAAYGNAEEIVGMFLEKKTVARDRLFISTKLLPNCLDDIKAQDYIRVIKENIKRSLSVLRTDYLDVYLLHSARYAFCPEILDALAAVGKEGLARYVGVSVYEPEEADACLGHPKIQFIQVPYSIFDHRMKESGVFGKASGKDCQVAARSAFIQGLITLQDDQVPPFLEKAIPILNKIQRMSIESGFSRIELAIGYVKREAELSHLVFGVDSIGQLSENIAAFQREIPEDLFRAMDKEFEHIDADIVMPSLWKK